MKSQAQIRVHAGALIMPRLIVMQSGLWMLGSRAASNALSNRCFPNGVRGPASSMLVVMDAFSPLRIVFITSPLSQDDDDHLKRVRCAYVAALAMVLLNSTSVFHLIDDRGVLIVIISQVRLLSRLSIAGIVFHMRGSGDKEGYSVVNDRGGDRFT